MHEIGHHPVTEVVRRALLNARDPREESDLLFFEAWERLRPKSLGAALRASQIRRANPDLAAAIELELKNGPPSPVTRL